MAQAGMISNYLDALEQAMRFDRALARAVRLEAEDHLREAVAADPAADRREAERRAVEKFGDPRVIAARFAVVSLVRQSRRVGITIILVIAAVFTAMKARVAWYATTQWAVADDMRAISGHVALVDRYAFWSAVIVGIVALAYLGAHRVPALLHPGYRRRVRRFVLLCAATAGALIVSVVCDGGLTAFRLHGAEIGVESLVPVFSMAIEILCAGVLLFQIRVIARRATSIAVVLKT